MAELADQRALRAILRVAVARLKGRLTPPRFNIPGDPSAGVYLSAFTGLGMVLVIVPVGDDAQVAAITAAIDDELSKLATQGPTPEELTSASAELIRSAEKADHDPRYWSEALSHCATMGLDPDEIAGAAAFYRGLTPEKARDTLARYSRNDRSIGLTIRAPKVRDEEPR
jgi:predicted Zn-dependent peptidase